MSGGALQFTRESGAEPAARRGAGAVLDLVRSDSASPRQCRVPLRRTREGLAGMDEDGSNRATSAQGGGISDH